MGYLRFRRTLKIAPGVRINISKGGVSTSLGPRGLHYTVGHGQRRTTIGVPGSGLSYTNIHRAEVARAFGHASTPSAAEPQAAHRQPDALAAIDPVAAPPDAPMAVVGYAGSTPPDKIFWGVILTMLVITSPIGVVVFIVGLVQLRNPMWRVRTYTKWAAKDPSTAQELLTKAAELAPNDPIVVKGLATLAMARGDFAMALPYLRQATQYEPANWLLHGQYAVAALKTGNVAEARPELEALRGSGQLEVDSRASVTAHLAYVHLVLEDPELALTLLNAEPQPLGKSGPGGHQCLYYRAVTQYLLGHAQVAMADLDHLYALDPTFAELASTKATMQSGTYELLLPDGNALVPLSPQELQSSVKRVKTQAASPHCETCGALWGVADNVCRYCGASRLPGALNAKAIQKELPGT